MKDTSGNDVIIDYNGYNTLSAGDVPGVGRVVFAPGGVDDYQTPLTKVFAFGYDSAFRPLAGWPATTDEFQFQQVAAAVGDANLDGVNEVLAADVSCFVHSWNLSGNWNPTGASYLWRQVTGSVGTSVENSSVAIGDVNAFADSNRMPDAVVGSHYVDSEVFGFPGDEWGDHSQYSPNYPAQWPPHNTEGDAESSPAIGLIDSDSDNDVAVCDDGGYLHLWLSSTRAWASYRLASNLDEDPAIKSSPAIVNLNSQRCVVVGCNNGRVYAVKSDGMPLTGWPAGGILLNSSAGYRQVRTSPIVGDVMGTGVPQIVVGSADGNVYVLWSDGNNHSNGPVAKVWTCAQSSIIEANSTPSICSLNGTMVSLIVGSQDGIYKFDLYSVAFIANSDRWPWPTFHRDNARTGCATAPSVPVSASIYGAVTLNNNPVPGARVSIRTTNGQPVPVYGHSAPRPDPVFAVGDGTPGNEMNEGYYCINELPPGATYVITATDENGHHSKTLNVSVTTGGTPTPIALTP